MAGKSGKTKGTNSSGKKINLKALISDERIPKVLGLTLIFVSVLLGLAFLSYLFNWKVDQSIPQGKQAANSIGQFGAYIAERFFRYGFGVMSFVIIPLLFLTGIKLINKAISIQLLKIYKYSFLSIVWFSVAFAFLFTFFKSNFPWGGAFGEYINAELINYIGKFGTGALLVFSLLVFLVIVFNINFQFNLSNLKKLTTLKKDSVFKYDEETEVTEWEKEIVQENQESEIILTPANDTERASAGPIEQADDGFEVVEVEKLVKPKKQEPTEHEIQLDVEEVVEEEILDEVDSTNYDPTLDLSDYKYPTIDLMQLYGDEKIKIDTEELEKNKNQIIETLRNYNIEISKIKATIGPTVTLYEIIPAAGVRISKIKNLEDDIALSLAALGIRIIAPIPGKGTIGIEVPNVKKEIVSMKTLLASEKFQHTKHDLPIALGKNIANEIYIEDLARMPHLLMAGATGQGKSVGLNAILMSLLYKKHPSQLKFVLIDPKKVELTPYKLIEKHFLAKLPGEEDVIITDTKKVINTLNALCIEMDQRYDLLKEAHVRNIKEYNAKFIARRLNPNKGHQFLPYIVLVIDEFADLMMTAGKEIETPIARLAQLARAIGIHLVIATQRPSVNIITGTIKANFPARIAFKVSAKVDSRTILDTGGADQLIGRGDMLLSNGGDVTRLQCCFVDTPDVEAVTKFISEQQGYPNAFLLPEYIDDKDDSFGGLGPEDRDEMFDDAARTIVQTQQGSTSMLQRRLKLGYNRAGRLMDQLEAAGIVGPSEGSKAREVLVKDMYELEQYLSEHKV